jgi:hypothetical protein
MNKHTWQQSHRSSAQVAWLVLVALLNLTACGTLEVGISTLVSMAPDGASGNGMSTDASIMIGRRMKSPSLAAMLKRSMDGPAT